MWGRALLLCSVGLPGLYADSPICRFAAANRCMASLPAVGFGRQPYGPFSVPGGNLVDFAEFKDVLLHQRAIREFDTSKPVDDAAIEQAIRIAEFAPNGGNRQPWRFLVVRDRNVKQKLAVVFDELGAAMDHSAP